MWPVHTWLPDAHVEAPTGGSVILAAIMLKMGGYGFVRLSLPIVPDGSAAFSTAFMITLSLIAVVYIGFVALMQKGHEEADRVFVDRSYGLRDARLLPAVAPQRRIRCRTRNCRWHGADGVARAYLRCHVPVRRRALRPHAQPNDCDYGGVANTMPVYAAFAVLFAMANAGLPGTSGFVGEFMVIIASFKANFWFAFFAATTLILGAAYTLWMVKRVIYGDVANEDVAELKDLNHREFIVLGVLAVSVLFVGLYPAPLVDMMNVSIEQLVEHIGRSKL